MDGDLSRFISEEGLAESTTHLRDCYRRSEEYVASFRDQLRAELEGSGLDRSFADVVAFGSLARREMTPESDLDYLVVVSSIPDKHHDPQTLLEMSTTVMSRRQKGGGMSMKPGASGLFARCTSAFDLIDRVGLQDDTNHNHTRRLLFLEESVSLLNPDMHIRILGLILQRYLNDSLGESGPEGQVVHDRIPRFLVNDVVRYWRTVAVDYQAKVDADFGREIWGLRYLKLIFTRKVTFASTVAVLLSCDGSRPATAENLALRLQKPPLARFAELADALGSEGRSCLASLLTLYDWFLQKSSDAEWRESVNMVSDRTNKGQNVDFKEARAKAREVHDSLRGLLVEDPLFANRTADYLVF